MSGATNRRRDPEKWTTKAFLDHFMRLQEQMPERAFAFVLGAGASVSAGIPTGAQLVDRWLRELQTRNPGGTDRPIEEWASAETLDIDDFQYDRRAEFYPQIYDRRFRDDPDEGYANLEDVLKVAEPTLGYSMLAQVLAETRHKVVITTNFDNLVADSILIFTETFAQMCGHESLTGFIRTQPRRPLVAKIHRDLLLGPQNDPYETNLLHEDWARALRKLFTRYTPLVIGYGGNDGSLMNFLESFKYRTIPGGIFWCYRQGGPLPNTRIRRLVARHAGKLVSIIDFDVFMVQLSEPLGFGLLDREIETRASQRASQLRKDWEKAKQAAQKPGKDHPENEAAQKATRLAKKTLEKVETRRVKEAEDWWSWELKARRASDSTKREQIYCEALKRLPDSAELTGAFAIFMKTVRKNYDEAERLYRRALELEPSNAIIAGNFAIFMRQVRKDHDEAERLYRQALELDPSNAGIIGNYAVFMSDARKDYDEAERLFRRALELDPADGYVAGNLTAFLLERGRRNEAKEMSDRAWGLTKDEPSMATAEVALYRGLLLQIDGADDTPALGRLKTAFKISFRRTIFSFGTVLDAAGDALSPDDKNLYTALAAAILDAEKVAALDELPRWRDVTSIALDEPWAPLAN